MNRGRDASTSGPTAQEDKAPMRLERITFGDGRVPARLWAKVEPDDNGCWNWTGNTFGYKRQYGSAWYKGTSWRAQRLFYALLVRPVEPTEHVHHECRNKLCVNPAHLEALAQEEHWGHGHADKTHCPQGHEYSDENTAIKWRHTAKGTWGPNRLCRTCLRERARVRAARIKKGS